jgi:2-polyprenyl-6-methoxyphenol hydroxylase-like FAD-dependent oxidoreductase
MVVPRAGRCHRSCDETLPRAVTPLHAAGGTLREPSAGRRGHCSREQCTIVRIAINGAGIAGPTLAWWLARAGHDVLLVEESPALRRGGYVIDFWGVGYDVAEKMGLLPAIRAAGYAVQDVRLVDHEGRRRGGFGLQVFDRLTGGRFTSLQRSDLSAAIFHALGDRVETRFGDSIAALHPSADSVHVEFSRAAASDFDLVVGADGLHSRVRALAFGPERQFEVALGYHVAAFELAGYRPRDELVYVMHGAPGRQISRFALRGDRTLFLFVFVDELLGGEMPGGGREFKSVLARVFGGVGWESGQILEAMESAEDIYFDRVSQIRMKDWTRGRIALAGDAAACVSLLAGEGSGLAMAEAYVLAYELARTPRDPLAALVRYESSLRDFLVRKQRSAAAFASALAPRTRAGIAFRNAVTRLLRIPAVADYFIGRDLRDDFTLPA